MTTAKNVLIVAFLAFQLLAPVRGFLFDKYETRGNFSWNMYSRGYGCRVEYTLTDPEGTAVSEDYTQRFNRPGRAGLTFHRDTLPGFHAYLCEELRREGSLGTVRASVGCALNYDSPRSLVDPEADICTAENYGVLRR